MKNKLNVKPHSELPLQKDGANLFLEIMTSISVFLFTITLAGYFMVGSLVADWNKGIVNGFTVQIMPESKVLDKQAQDLRLNKVVDFFEKLPEVKKVSIVKDKQMKRLLSPWLGNELDLSSLPVPQLLDIRLKEGTDFDFSRVAKDLSEVASYTSINSHQIWLNRLIKFASTIKMLALSVLLMVLTISAFSIFYATKTSLGIHRDIIEILHIMGAKDDYIAKQYARRSFFIGLLSGIIGVIFGALALWFISTVAIGLKGGILDKAVLDFKAWSVIFSLPMLTAIISMFTGYYTVKRTLGKIM